jgi:YHS domain-containing protein
VSWHPACVLNEDGLIHAQRGGALRDSIEVNPVSAEAQSEYEGVTFYFCSQECSKAFDADPLRYLDEVDLAEARANQQSQGR